jgi:hypothetical protein
MCDNFPNFLVETKIIRGASAQKSKYGMIELFLSPLVILRLVLKISNDVEIVLRKPKLLHITL